MKVTLKTSNGHYIRDAELPAFNEYPQVLLWGDAFGWRRQRVFAKTSPGEYRECFFYIVVDRPTES